MKTKLSIVFLLITIYLNAQIPANYYNTAVGKYGAALKTQLCTIVAAHTERTYAQLWTDFQTTDKRADGYVWDMYSNCSFTFVTQQDAGSGGTSECQYYNREHSMPNSWFNKEYPMYSDLFHMYPTDKYVNNQRGNNPFGETSSPSKTFINGSKLGASSFSGYSGTVYEPVDEYKGDFARTYFYMVTAYDDKVATWVSDQLAGNKYPALSDWSVILLLKWNSQDPVSTKETSRNNAVYSIQGNRNPFIDHPELAEYIWGTHKTDAWALNAGVADVHFSFSVSYNTESNELLIDTNENSPSYKIFNINGQTLQTGTLAASKTLFVNTYTPGMYILQLTSGSRTAIKKFIINR
jgi:endonuclease I